MTSGTNSALGSGKRTGRCGRATKLVTTLTCWNCVGNHPVRRVGISLPHIPCLMVRTLPEPFAPPRGTSATAQRRVRRLWAAPRRNSAYSLTIVSAIIASVRPSQRQNQCYLPHSTSRTATCLYRPSVRSSSRSSPSTLRSGRTKISLTQAGSNGETRTGWPSCSPLRSRR
jgi:hypothetical protein